MAKARYIGQGGGFEPVTIEVVLESQEELDLFASIFNHIPICDMEGVAADWGKSILEAAKIAGGDARKYTKALWAHVDRGRVKWGD